MIETDRLILRPPLVSDLDGWAALMSDEDAMRFLAGPQPRPLAWRNLMMMAGSWSLCGFGMFSVLDRASGTWIGRIGPWYPEGWPARELGWALLPSAQGRGLAFEAGCACLQFCFETLGWTDVVHCIDLRNAPSIALAERLGSGARGRVEMPPPYEGRPYGLWGQTRDEFDAAR